MKSSGLCIIVVLTTVFIVTFPGKGLSHPVVVDGNPAEWTLAVPPSVNLGHIARNGAGEGEYVWIDAPGDERTDFANSSNVDILQIRVTSDSNNIYFLVEMAGITIPAGDGAPQVQIAIDLDHLTGSGQQWLGANSDTMVADLARWEFLIVTRFGSGQVPAVYDPSFAEVGLGLPQSAISGNFIEISVPLSVLPGPGGLPAQFTVVSLMADASDGAWDISGVSDVLDAITNYGDPGDMSNTWAEVSDGVVDYHFSVWFHLDPDLEPSAPLVVNEVLYDGINEPQDEWIEVFNRSGLADFPLDGYKLGDEETIDGGEGMAAFPAGGTVGLDDVALVANDGLQFTNNYGFAADFELNDTSSAGDMIDYSLWATGNVNLSNSSDEVLLVDPYDTVIDAISWGSGAWPGVTPAADVVESHSLERPQSREDSDDCSHDMLDQTTPTPGQVFWLLGLGSSCGVWVECQSDFCVDSVCCENACDGICDAICDSSGTCQPKDCSDGSVCTDDSCNPADGTCMHSNNTASCDDGDACTAPDLCSGGTCSSTPISCDDGNVCTDDSCDSVTGCVYVNNTASCDDGDACTTGDACSGGICTVTPVDCDDGNICTDDSCNPADGTCMHSNNTASCDDGDVCTSPDSCSGGVCSGTLINCNDMNPCTDDSCDTVLGCVFTDNADVCDDGDACTTGDACAGGACSGTLISCVDGNVCTDDSCDSGSGCVYTNNNDSCDDGDACTSSDMCSGGACSGTPISCDDSNLCTDDSCDSATGCMHVNNTAACNDGDVCTITDSCSEGSCSGTPISCNDNNLCTDDSCDSATGCTYTNNSAACDDGDACTSGDVCSAGVCAGTPITCDDSNPCSDDSCDPSSGCVFTPNSAFCDDGDACTTSDVCSGGLCTGTTITCDDNNNCTDDSCEPASGCVFNPNTALCDDSDPCTVNDFCLSGTCQGVPKDCDDLDPCTDDSCAAGTGNCQHLPNTASCDDGDACTTSDACADGVCSGSAISCNDGNICTDDSCDSALGCVFTPNSVGCDDGDVCTMNDACDQGSCNGVPLDADGDGYVSAACGGDDCDDSAGQVNPDAFEGPYGDAVCSDGKDNDCDGASDSADNGCDQCVTDANCDDGNVCNGIESCASGLCQAGTSLNCDDGDICTDDSCDKDSGCQHVANTAGCDDGNSCTDNDSCSGGVCGGTTIVCDDGNVCTDDACDSSIGCVFTNNTTGCNDGDACTSGDICLNGACAGVALDCSTLDDACNAGTCNPASGLCEKQALADGTACDDGDVCTESDGCYLGNCSGAAIDCDDGDPCTDDSCDPTSGCYHSANTAVCDDGDSCTTSDVCASGVCSGTAVDCSSLDDECHVGTCDPADGSCFATVVDDGTACDDGDPCTDSDSCMAGSCDGMPKDCSALIDDCNQAACDPQSGSCQAVPLTDGVLCDDGDECTAGEHCIGGVCTGGMDACRDQGSSGCGCAATGGSNALGLLGLLALLGLALTRRREGS